MHVTGLKRKSTARRSRRASTRRATSYTHTPTCGYARTASPDTVFRRAPSPKGSPLRTARSGEDRPAAATARTSCSWSVSSSRSPMLLTAAADANRGAGREREREREADTYGVSEHRQPKKTTRSRRGEEGDRSANYSAAEQRAHAPAGFHSAVYRRVCAFRESRRILFRQCLFRACCRAFSATATDHIH